MKILVSACLLGVSCRFDGKSKPDEKILRLLENPEIQLIPVCPEILGGLGIPRPPCEIKGGKVLTEDGIDRTAQYERGAEETLKIARLFGCEKAILKEKSPSCGFGKIYDGNFTHTLVEGNGITASLLEKNGIEIATL